MRAIMEILGTSIFLIVWILPMLLIVEDVRGVLRERRARLKGRGSE